MNHICDTYFKENERQFLERYHEEAILAGGAVRDRILGKPSHDFDFYIQNKKGLETELKRLGFRHARSQLESGTLIPLPFKTNGKVTHIYDDPNIVGVYKSGKFDVIVTKTDPVEHVDNFSINLSKCYSRVDSVGNILTTVECEGFREDVDNKKITVDLTSHLNPNFFRAYLPKIMYKFSDYRVSLENV